MRLKAQLKNSSTLSVSLGGKSSVGVSIQQAGEKVSVYEGDYEITPQVDEQSLQTAKKYMKDDVTVKAIPFIDVSNPAGGQTIYIGSEVI